MSRAVGSSLPPPLFHRLRGDDLAARMGVAVLIVTVDGTGSPHPAMLSYGEMVAVDAQRIRFAVHRASGTAENLRRSGRITFCFVEPGMAYYVKGTVTAHERTLPARPSLAGFEAAVQTVLKDAAQTDTEPGAAIVDGVRFSLGRPVSAVLRDWREVVDGLREAR